MVVVDESLFQPKRFCDSVISNAGSNAALPHKGRMQLQSYPCACVQEGTQMSELMLIAGTFLRFSYLLGFI